MIRWGVIGPGAIATGFADAMNAVDGGVIVAVGSRSQDRADLFGARFDVPNRYGDYSSVAEDPEVDAIYVATPQSRHETDTLMCLQAGKHVLCEKPFALNSAQAHRMIDEARHHGMFLMEAIWSRFLPAYQSLAKILDAGTIGEPLLVEADFGYRASDPNHRLSKPELGGGGLLDLGIYPIQLCSLVLGPAERVVADGVLGETGVDEQVAAILHCPGDTIGVVKAAIKVNMSCRARISGTTGWIELPALMHCPNSLAVTTMAGTEQIDASYDGNGLRFEIDEVNRLIESGQRESQVMPLDETLSMARTLDEIRSQIGLVFPGE